MKERAVSRDAGLKKMLSFFSRNHHKVASAVAGTTQHGISLENILSGLPLANANDNKPDFALLDVICKYLLELNENKDEFNALDDQLKKIILLLRNTCVHAYHLATEYETRRNQFEINPELHRQKYQYLTLSEQSENDFQMALSKYNIALHKIREDIDLLQASINEVKSADSESKIRNLEVYSKTQQDTAAQLEVANSIINSAGIFHYFLCFVPERVKRAHKKMAELESTRTLLSTANTADLKHYLVVMLEADCESRKEDFDALLKAKPMRDEQYAEKYIEIEAKLRSDEFEYFSKINHELMLDFLKIGFMLNKISNSLKKNNLIPRPDNIRQLFVRFKDSFESMAEGFYCEEPGRYYFNYYLKNMRAIKENQTLNNILVGGATVDELRQVIPNYENGIGSRLAPA